MKNLLFLSFILLVVSTSAEAVSPDSVLAQYCGKTVGELSGLSSAGVKPTKTWFENALFEPLKALLDVACETVTVLDTGVVVSVGLALPTAEFTVSGTPVTTAGTLTGVWKSQTARKAFIAPDTGNGIPYFRPLYAADITDFSASSRWDGILNGRDVAVPQADSSVTAKLRPEGNDSTMFRIWKNNIGGALHGETWLENWIDGVRRNYIYFSNHTGTTDPVVIWPNLDTGIFTCTTINGYSPAAQVTRIDSLEKRSFGGIYTYDNAVATVIADTLTWTPIHQFTAPEVGTNMLEYYATDDFLAPSASLGGYYMVNFSGSFICETTALCEFAVYNDGVIQNMLRTQVTLSATETRPVSMSGAIYVAGTKYVRLYCQNRTDMGDITMKTGSLFIRRIK